MKGTQKLQLSYEAVLEAIHEYLARRSMEEIQVEGVTTAYTDGTSQGVSLVATYTSHAMGEVVNPPAAAGIVDAM